MPAAAASDSTHCPRGHSLSITAQLACPPTHLWCSTTLAAAQADAPSPAPAKQPATVADLYPFVSLVSSKDTPLCVGTLVAPWAVLTAASCVTGGAPPDLVHVGLFNSQLDEFRCGQLLADDAGTLRSLQRPTPPCMPGRPSELCAPLYSLPCPQAAARVRDPVGGAGEAPPQLH